MFAIEFTNNHQDLSTESGFQFKFFCERCGDGYLSTWQANKVGIAASLLRGAGRIFGGVLGRASGGSYEIQEAIGGPAHDAALRRAVSEIRLLFRKCRRCGDWMCVESCWNDAAKMCERCAPRAEEEDAAVRAQAAAGAAAAEVGLEEQARLEARAAEVAASCPDCGAATLGKRFCPGCGRKVAAGESHCSGCGARLTPGARFCGDCGAKA